MAGPDAKCQCGREYPPITDVKNGELFAHVMCARFFISHFQTWVRDLDSTQAVPKEDLEAWIDFLVNKSGWDLTGIDAQDLEAFAGAN